MEVSGQLHARFIPEKSAPGTYWIGGWVDTETVWKLWNKEKSLVLAGNRTPTVQPAAYLYIECAIQAPV
jgi:hypothetical protein